MKDISFGRYTSVLYRHMQILLNEDLAEYGLGSGQYLYLISLSKSPGMNQKELTARLSMDKATTAKALNKLESEGYIERLKDEHDRRNYRIYLTEKGRDFMPVLKDILDDLTKVIIKGMQEEEVALAASLFDRMIRNITQEVEHKKAPSQSN